MKVYILGQQTYCEGNFRDLELGSYNILGVYSSIEKALEAKGKVKVVTFHAQFGGADTECEIQEHELDCVDTPVGTSYEYDM